MMHKIQAIPALIQASAKRSFLLLIPLLFTLACGADNRTKESLPDRSVAQVKQIKKAVSAHADEAGIPDKVYTVLKYILAHDRAPDGYTGGRKFGNYEKHLPLIDTQGNAMRYREWDVNPKKKGKNRGAERLITSENKRAWYTRDHYNTFTEIK